MLNRQSKLSARKIISPILVLFSLAACMGTADRYPVVENFSLQRYLGTWYEIARLDHSFERGLSRVTAQYSLRDDGGVRVINKGYKTEKSKWESAEGKAYFIDAENVGALKVSFFGPFYGAYNIVALDHEGYSYSLVAGPNRKYLWILARSPEIEPAILDSLLEKAQELGFDTDLLIYPEHESD